MCGSGSSDKPTPGPSANMKPVDATEGVRKRRANMKRVGQGTRTATMLTEGTL